MSDHLRPIERRVLQLRDEGHELEEIARRFRRSSDHIERILAYTELPRAGRPPSQSPLRPLERRVLGWREEGVSYGEIGRMFKRSPDHIRRVEGMAYLRKGLSLLG
ncbi:MAG: hypothetical protein ACRDVM_04300 [Acidimicrobiia bacterium]